MTDPNEILKKFFTEAGTASFINLVETLFPLPSTLYDDLAPHTHPTWFVVNYLDACCFQSIPEACHANEVLQILLHNIGGLDQLPIFDFLKLEYEFQTKNIFFSPFETERTERKQAMAEGWKVFSEKKPEFAALLKPFLPLPWLPFAYKGLRLPETPASLNFIEPCADLETANFQNNQLFLFRTPALFFQALQFPKFVEKLVEENQRIYILSMYPQNQFEAQKKLDAKENLSFADNEGFTPAFSVFLKVIENALNAFASGTDKEAGDWLYQLGKKALFEDNSQRFGKSRAIAVKSAFNQSRWHDRHKNVPLNKNLGPPSTDYLGEWIKEGLSKRSPNDLPSSPPYRLVHIVPQMKDNDHAPTRLLKQLCQYADPNQFDISVIVTEAFKEHPFDYPFPPYVASASEAFLSPATREFFQNLKIPILFNNDCMTYWHTVNSLLAALQEKKWDIAVFHGCDEMNNLISASTPTALRFFFEHGSLPVYRCYDAGIFSTEASQKKVQDWLPGKTLEFSLDLQESWPKDPPTKTELGLPEDSFVMTTISNNLENRLGKEMQEAIVEILKKVPNAIYAPMGGVDYPETLLQFFKKEGVDSRVKLLGHRKPASHYARCMQLYLNEFPFGSCIGMLDAMAARCPVVTMYDKDGPPQARYGGDYFGFDRAIHTGKKEDYVNLACRLATDPLFYKEWSDHAKREYEKRSDPKKFVKEFENYLLTKIKAFQTPATSNSGSGFNTSRDASTPNP